MQRPFLFATLAAAAALMAAPLALLTERRYQARRAPAGNAAVVRLAGRDWGYPTPFQFYPRGPGYIHMSFLFDTLVWKDARGLMGLLARSWSVSKDGREYVFTLRPGARWTDGVRVTARDAAFTFGYLKRHNFRWRDLGIVQSASALDDRRVQVRLRGPYAPFLEDIAGAVPILPEHIWRGVKDPQKFAGPQAVVGCGPFRLASYDKTDGSYCYAANERYYLGRPRVGRLEFVAVGDTLLALRRGEIDAAGLWTSQLTAVDQFRGDPRLRILQGPSGWVLRLVFNHARPEFARRELRLAFAHALDLRDIAARLRHGCVEPGRPGFLPPESLWSDPNLPAYTYDLAKARDLVRRAGLPRRRFTLLAPVPYVREAEYVASQAKRIGLEVRVQSLPLASVDGLLRAGRFDLAVIGHGGVGGDPDVLRRQFCARGRRGAGSALDPATAYGYDNPKLDALADAQLRELDPRRRRALVRRMQALIARDAPTLALWYPHIYFVFDPKRFDGWFYTPGGIAGGIPLALNKLAFIERRTP